MDDKADQLFTRLFNDKPALHSWGGVDQTAGFEDDSLRSLFNLALDVSARGDLRILETGAGLSSLAMLCASPSIHLAVCPEPATLVNMHKYAAISGIDMAPFQFIEGRSEIALPQLVLGKDPEFTLALIDGGHNFPQCWIDYVYCAYAMREGGVLVVDDIEIYSCRTLALYLNGSPLWRSIGGHPAKCRYFQKVSNERFDGDFGTSPLIMANMLW